MRKELVKSTELADKELADNPTQRLPVCLCLDTSGSMGAVEGGTSRIQALENGINLFKENICNDDVAKRSAEICIVTFNNQAGCITDFTTIDGIKDKYGFIPEGGTALGEGVNEALDCVERRKKEYKNYGVPYFQPWLVLMTDGQGNGDPSEFKRACKRVADMVNNKKLTVFPIVIGNEVDLSELLEISGKKPLKLKGLNFKEFFAWLSQSVSAVSQSTPEEPIKIDITDIEKWAEL